MPTLRSLWPIRLRRAPDAGRGACQPRGHANGAARPSSEGARRLCEYVWAGVIGQVTEVYCWCDRLNAREQPLAQDSECPKNLDWDKWIGPAAWRDYNKGIHPVGWYSWRRFGSATIGNMGNHIIDPVFWALKLGSQESVQLVDFRPGAEGHGAFATISSGSSRSVVTLRLSRCMV